MSVLKKFRKAAQKDSNWASLDNKPTHKTRKGGKRDWETEGAWRRDEDGIYYWFTLEQLDDIDAINDEVPAGKEGDAEFWRLFREYRLKNNVTSSRKATTDERRDWYTGKYSWTDTLKGVGGSLSSYWTGWSSNKFLGSDLAQRTALALRAVSTTVNVIDDSGVRMRVLASDPETNQSYTDFKDSTIVVSPKPLMDKSITSDGEAIDIMTGYGLHEASHSMKRGTRPHIGKIDDPEPLRPRAVAALLLNIAEDVRIEALTSEDFPGFAAYLEKMNAYVWNDVKVPEKYGPDLTSKLNAVIGTCKWPNETKPLATKWEVEFKWWRAWQEGYSTDHIREHVQKAIDHLRLPTEEEEEQGKPSQAAGEMDQQEEREKQIEEMDKALESVIQDFLQKNSDINKFCSHRPHKGDEKIVGDDAEKVRRLVEEQLEKEDAPIRMPDGSETPPLYISKPLEDEYSKNAYSDKPDPMLARYKAALIFRQAKPEHTITLLREGDVNEDELWRWAADDWRVFQEKHISRDPNVRCYLLVDISGSMGGPKVKAAQRMTRLFVEALSSIHGVTHKVFAHTGDVNIEGSTIYRIWEHGDPMSRIGLLSSLPHGNNYDGHAIAWVAKKMDEEAMPGEQRILIVLSDGLPAGAINYGGPEAMDHVRDVVNDAQRRKDIRVLQIAIDNSLDDSRQSHMFDEYIPYRPGDSLDKVPGRLTRWLERIL